jgi:hypothetical protein
VQLVYGGDVLRLACLIALAVVVAPTCYIVEPAPARYQQPPPHDPPPTRDLPSSPRHWSVTKSGDACVAEELYSTCAVRSPCNPPPRRYACPAGVAFDRPITVEADGDGCIVLPPPCPPGSANMQCVPQPGVRVACP